MLWLKVGTERCCFAYCITCSTSGVLDVDKSSTETEREGLLDFLFATNVVRERETAAHPWAS
jgi:hypothetical protein